MRIVFLLVVIICGSVVGSNMISNVREVQDSRMKTICEQIPHGAAMDDVCNKYR